MTEPKLTQYAAAFTEVVLSTTLFDRGARDGLLEWSLNPGQPTDADCIYTTPGALTDEQWDQMGQPDLIVGNTLADIASVMGISDTCVHLDGLQRIGRVTQTQDRALLRARSVGAPIARLTGRSEWVSIFSWLGPGSCWRSCFDIAPGTSSWVAARSLKPPAHALDYFPGTLVNGLWFKELQSLSRRVVW